MSQGVMTVRELAVYFKVHQSTIYRMMRRSTLPRFKIGSDWRFLRIAVDAWVIEEIERCGNGAALAGQRLRAAK